MDKVFQFIKAARFFPAYAPTVRDWKKKLTHRNGRGNPTDFTEADRAAIRAGLKRLFADMQQPAHETIK